MGLVSGAVRGGTQYSLFCSKFPAGYFELLYIIAETCFGSPTQKWNGLFHFLMAQKTFRLPLPLHGVLRLLHLPHHIHNRAVPSLDDAHDAVLELHGIRLADNRVCRIAQMLDCRERNPRHVL